VAARQYVELTFTVYPGADNGTTRVYEDDGLTTAYLDGAYAWTRAEYQRTPDSLTLKVATEGQFPELPTNRVVNLEIVNAPPASKVSVNGAEVPFGRFGGSGTWSYDGQSLTLVVQGVAVPTTETVVIDVEFVDTVTPHTYSGYKGLLRAAVLAKRNLDETRATPGAHTPAPAYTCVAAAMGETLALLAGVDPSAMLSVASNLSATYSAALVEIQALMPPPPPPPGALVQMFNKERNDHILCGTTDCAASQDGYTQVRVEGFQPDKTEPNAVPLNDFWNPGNADNWVSTSSEPTHKGYSAAGFTDGFVLNASTASTAPLECYMSEDGKDHMSVATDAGRAEAKTLGYSLCTDTPKAYVYTKPKQSGTSMRANGVDATRVSYSIALLQAALL